MRKKTTAPGQGPGFSGTENPGLHETLYSVKNLSKIFPPGGFRALSGINLELRAGGCTLIAGSNGSGKTLLMRLLAGLLDPTEGEIFFHGKTLSKSLDRLRREVGLIFQDAEAQIVGETVAEDIAFGPKNLGLSRQEVAGRVAAALAAFGLETKRDFSPRRLSGGEKRRLAAAGIIAMQAETVIMDEPFANLDWPGVVQTLEIIRTLENTGKTVILLTHELEKALALADRLIILHRGTLRDDGKPGDVLNRLDPAWGVRDPRRNYRGVEDCSWLVE
ncbi:MAG: energy-coupling factor ABC transporter ATP-binding protein [Treponema sp.]|jgi:biotin transport system ATP-binding protein|nr:energy-coupling factor ABC transporter ATP-binding protein [Treponema sp.]